MIQVSQALSIIEANTSKMPIQKIKVAKSLGFILAEAIYSPMDMPPFRQSAMDGYAFLHDGCSVFELAGISQAGDFLNMKTEKHQAIRILTGAFVPDDLDTVVMQEHTSRSGESVLINSMPVPFANIRKRVNK